MQFKHSCKTDFSKVNNNCKLNYDFIKQGTSKKSREINKTI